MHITITDAEYQELMRVKREHERVKTKIADNVLTLKDGIKNNKQLSKYGVEQLGLIIRVLEELLK